MRIKKVRVRGKPHLEAAYEVAGLRRGDLGAPSDQLVQFVNEMAKETDRKVSVEEVVEETVRHYVEGDG